MKPQFSFLYDNIRISSSDLTPRVQGDSFIYDVDDRLTVTAVYRQFPGADACHWVLYFENRGERNTGILSDIRDCDALLPLNVPEAPRPGFAPRPGNLCVISMKGCGSNEAYGRDDALSALEFGQRIHYLDRYADKCVELSSARGRSSNGTMPFFDVTASDAGYFVAVGWSGDWKAEITGRQDGAQVCTGLKYTGFCLRPGEKLRTTGVLIMAYERDEDRYNKFRRLIRDHFSHLACTGADREGLFAYELWGGLNSGEMKRRLSALTAHGACFEDVWIDAGWYGGCTVCDDPYTGDWEHYTGDWRINENVHPDGLAEVAETARAGDMSLMLWLEPERAYRGTPMAEEHPEWFIELPGSSDLLLNYGVPEALDYVCHVIEGYVERLQLSCYRQDFNLGAAAYFEAADEADRRGITEIRHITGVYELWDRLLARFPHLIIDNCASGGRRIDIETVSRSIPFFRSDYQCLFNEEAEVLQVHNCGLSRILPFNGCTTKTKNDLYNIRSSYSSSWGGAFWNNVLQDMDEGELDWAAAVCREYRRIRGYLSRDFYSHASNVFDPTGWTVWQYHDPEKNAGVVLAFRRSRSPFDRVTICLSGLRADAKVRYENLDTAAVTTGGPSLTIVLDTPRSCVAFEYRAE